MSRVRRLRELGQGLMEWGGGEAWELVKSCQRSAVSLVNTITSLFPGFRDCSIYKGSHVWFLKRAQILVADLWGALKEEEEGRCDFYDINRLTMFADYRVPQLLREEGIMVYDPSLARRVDEREEIQFGSEEESEIRGGTIQAVELLKHSINKRLIGLDLSSVQIDWLLWQKGEERKDLIKPHHRTLTTFY